MKFSLILIFFCFYALGCPPFQACCSAPVLAGGNFAVPLIMSRGRVNQDEAVGPWVFKTTQLHVISQPYTYAAGAEKVNQGYRWKEPPPVNPDWHGIKLDTVYFVAYQFVAVAILYFSPEALSGWSQEDKDNYSLERWEENVTNPVWDEDKWWVNYILHPYWGATYYIRARERGFGKLPSFWYSALLSTLYEFGAEALFEPVSIQDLIVTPVAGSLVGEYVFTPIREWIRSQPGEFGWLDKAVLTLTDPFGVINAGVNRIFGVTTSLSFQHFDLTGYRPLPGVPDVAGDTMQAGHSTRQAWGLQMTIPW